MIGESQNAARDQRHHPTLADASRDADGLAARDALALQFRPYVYKLARELVARLRLQIDVDDLAGWGCLGLLEAAARYDGRRGVRFRSFAHARIRGAMLDAIRSQHGRRLRNAPSDTASHEPECFDAAYRDLGQSHRAPRAAGPATSDLEDAPDSELIRDETRRLLEAAIAELSPLERIVVVRHYVHGETVCAIAQRQNLSKSWLSRVHARAVVKLRRAYARLERGARHP
jgi:RNA polymerase sigma factor for flagellar operon FliA